MPGFVDVVLNFDTTVMHDDNILLQFHATGKRIVFYGDDTWIRMFPELFQRSDGTTSFFVTDYTEVPVLSCYLNFCLNISHFCVYAFINMITLFDH